MCPAGMFLHTVGLFDLQSAHFTIDNPQFDLKASDRHRHRRLTTTALWPKEADAALREY